MKAAEFVSYISYISCLLYLKMTTIPQEPKTNIYTGYVKSQSLIVLSKLLLKLQLFKADTKNIDEITFFFFFGGQVRVDIERTSLGLLNS